VEGGGGGGKGGGGGGVTGAVARVDRRTVLQKRFH